MPDDLDDVLQISFDALPLDAGGASDDDTSADERFQVVDVEGEERISGLFEYDVVFEEPIVGAQGGVRAAPALPIDELTGTDVTLSFHRGDHTVRHVNGIVARLVHEHTSGTVAAADRQRYRVKIRPELWLLTLTNDYRSFEGETVPDIVATVLDEYQIPYDEDSLDENLKDRYRPRKHVVQSGQSTFDFVDGLLEEAGIFYFFRQQAGAHTIVFGDDNMVFPAGPRTGENGPPVLRMGTRDQNDERTLWSGALEENVVPDGHRIGDTHFDGAATVQQRESGEASVERKGRPLDVVEYPGGADRSTDDTPKEHGPDILRRRLQQHQASKRLLRGTAPVRGLGTGQVFGLSGHDHGPINDTEFVTRRLFVEASPAEGYRVEYEAFPSSTRFRGYRYAGLEGPGERRSGPSVGTSDGTADGPSSTQLRNSPVFEGRDLSLHLGTVVRASGAEKKKGKVKVKFDWAYQQEEVWARVLQFSAGPPGDQSWGSQFVPREDAKVIVAQEQGARESSNMDPIVLGVLYQGEDKLPYPNGGNTEGRSAIRTHSARGTNEDAVHNEIRFVDDANAEEIGTFAPHKMVDAVGFEEDVQGGSLNVTVHKLEADSSNFAPPAAVDPGTNLSPSEYDSLPDTKKDAWYRLTYDAEKFTILPVEDKGYEGRIRASTYNGMDEKSTFEWKDKYSKKDFFRPDDEIKGFDEYMKLDRTPPTFEVKPKHESQIKEYQGRDIIHITNKNINLRQGNNTVNYSDYEKLYDETRCVGGVGVTKEGVENVITFVTSLLSAEGIFEVTLGKDAFGTASPTRDCYELKTAGQDAYEGPGATKEAYSDEITRDPFNAKDAGANRIEYTAGHPSKDGVFEACNGRYRIHAHGSRMEIYRADSDVDDDADAADFFQQEIREDWSPEGPEKLNRFEDEDDSPIVVMNKGGGISIRSDDGINIESAGDINIQSGGSIQMRADDNISCYAEDELTHYGRDILIGKRRGKPGISTNVTKKGKICDSDADIHHISGRIVDIDRKIKRDKEWISHTKKHIASSHRFIWNVQEMLSNQQVAYTNAQIGLKTEGCIIDLSLKGIDKGADIVDIKNGIMKAKNKIMESKNEVAESDSQLIIEQKGIAAQKNRGIKKSK